MPAKAKNEKFPCHRGNRTTLAAAAGSGGGMTKLAKLEQHPHSEKQSLDKARKTGGPPPEGRLLRHKDTKKEGFRSPASETLH